MWRWYGASLNTKSDGNSASHRRPTFGVSVLRAMLERQDMFVSGRTTHRRVMWPNIDTSSDTHNHDGADRDGKRNKSKHNSRTHERACV